MSDENLKKNRRDIHKFQSKESSRNPFRIMLKQLTQEENADINQPTLYVGNARYWRHKLGGA